MSDIKQTTTKSEAPSVDENGAVVERRSEQIHTETAANPSTVAKNSILLILSVIETLLLLRFVFKLTGANPSSGFIEFIYAVSGVLSAPFDTIFGATSTSAGSVQSVFEPSILVAAVIYGLIAGGLIKLLTLNRAGNQTSV